MEAMTDVLFYNEKISPATIIEGYKHVLNIPTTNDEVVFGDNVYVVLRRVFDFNKNTVHVVVKGLKKKIR